MIILNRKRIILLILTLMLLCFIILQNNFVYGSEINSFTVILDAGHGEPDGGAVSDSGISEEEINLQIVFKLQELLEQSGYNIILTRSDENGIYDLDATNKKSSDLKNRVEIANSEEADIFVSIHLNKISRKSVLWVANFLSRK